MLDLHTHLYTAYIVITNAEWIANNKRFFNVYDPTNPIEVFWRHIDDVAAYAYSGSTPYSRK